MSLVSLQALAVLAAAVFFLLSMIGYMVLVGAEYTANQQHEMTMLRVHVQMRRMQLVHHLADERFHRQELRRRPREWTTT